MTENADSNAPNGESLLDLVRSIASDFDAKIAFICERVPSRPDTARTLALSVDHKLLDNIEYKLTGTPCERVYEQGTLFHPRNVCELYPQDEMLTEWGVESYMGLAMYDSKGMLVGHLGLLSDAPMSNEAELQKRLRDIAARAGVELERRRTRRS